MIFQPFLRENKEGIIFGKLVIGRRRSWSSVTVTLLRISVRWQFKNSDGNSGNGVPAIFEQDLIESLDPGQFNAESTLFIEMNMFE